MRRGLQPCVYRFNTRWPWPLRTQMRLGAILEPVHTPGPTLMAPVTCHTCQMNEQAIYDNADSSFGCCEKCPDYTSAPAGSKECMPLNCGMYAHPDPDDPHACKACPATQIFIETSLVQMPGAMATEKSVAKIPGHCGCPEGAKLVPHSPDDAVPLRRRSATGDMCLPGRVQARREGNLLRLRRQGRRCGAASACRNSCRRCRWPPRTAPSSGRPSSTIRRTSPSASAARAGASPMRGAPPASSNRHGKDRNRRHRQPKDQEARRHLA